MMKVERVLRWLFARYGRYIAKQPWPFLIIPLVVTIALGIGLFVSFSKVIDSESLYGPRNSQSRRNRLIIEDLYADVSGHSMLPRHKIRRGSWGRVIITPLGNGNVLNETVITDVLRLHDTIMEVAIQEGDDDYKFTDLCLAWRGKCLENEFLVQLRYNPKRATKTKLTYPLTKRRGGGGSVFIGSQLGGVVLNENDEVTQASRLQLSYYLRHDAKEDEERGLEWEKVFLRQVQEFHSDTFTVNRIAEHSFSEELDKSSAITFYIVAIVGVVIGSFSVLSTSVMDWVQNKPVLTSAGVLSAGLALASTFGLLSYLGVPYANVAGSMPFLILGIGVDDIFIMISAWRRTSIYKSTEDRMSETMEDSAFSITITSITDVLAFGLGCISQFYSIQLLCLYAAVCIAFAYFYVITFFAACMVLSGRREKKNLHALTLRKVRPKDDTTSKAYAICCSGGTAKQAQEDRQTEVTDPLMASFFMKYFGPFLTHPVSAAGTVLLYLGYLAVAIWGVLNLEEGLDLSNASSDGSYLRAFFQVEESFFRVYGPDMSVVALERLDYWDPYVQDAIENIIVELESSEYFYDESLTISWLRDYILYLKKTAINQPSKDIFMSHLREHFLKDPRYETYGPDIIFNECNTSIISSRFYVIGKELDKTTKEIPMFLKIRQVLEDSPLDLVAYHAEAPNRLEQYISVRQNSIVILSIGIAVMFVIALVLIPNLIVSIIVTGAVISTVFGMIGYMALWDVPLDSVSMITLIPSLGFSVDFSAHVGYAYISAAPRGSSRRLRSISALYSVGTPILQGAVSTILAMIVLATIDSYIFRTFFKTMFLVITIGMVHGLVFLPIFLMLLVPSEISYCRPDDGNINDSHNEDDAKKGWSNRRSRNGRGMKLDQFFGFH